MILGKGRFLALAAAVLMVLGAASANAKMVPKIDNFIIFPDQSGSMYMAYDKTQKMPAGPTKIALVKELMLKMNDRIPELGYKGAIDMFAPWQVVYNPATYARSSFGNSLATLPMKQEAFGRLTPMGPGMETLPTVLSTLKGKTAVIMLSDGEANQGTDPVMIARQTVANYPNVCFHVVSFATSDKGKAVLKGINEAGKGCVWAEGPKLLADQAALDQFVKDVFYTMTGEQQESVVLRGIRFDFDKSNIKAEWTPLLDEAADIMKKRPDMKVVVGGHTDFIGTDAYNQKLSERRANAVYKYLIGKGVAANRMKVVGYGESQPVAPGKTDEDRAMNRRVQFEGMN